MFSLFFNLNDYELVVTLYSSCYDDMFRNVWYDILSNCKDGLIHLTWWKGQLSSVADLLNPAENFPNKRIWIACTVSYPLESEDYG